MGMRGDCTRGRYEGHLFEPVMLALITKGLPAPESGQDLQALVQQLRPNLAVGRLPDLAKAAVIQRSQSDR
jgi:hypothetical protein